LIGKNGALASESRVAINPPSDIVLDVARAVDPLQYSTASQRLERLGQAVGAEPEDFSRVFDAVDASAGSGAALEADPARADLRSRLPAGPRQTVAQPPEAYQRFEAFVLQSFVQAMFPKHAEGIFGQGMAGEVWKSMLAEQIAGQMAKAGGIGIASEIAAAHPAATVAADQRPRALMRGYLASAEMGFADAVRPQARDDASLAEEL
jgi:Rod binding domain-containing protein